MALSAFDDRTRPPAEDELAAALGATAPLWDELRRRIAARLGPTAESWGCSSATTGWGLRIRRGERAILYLVPQRGRFLASFALGEKAAAAALSSGLPARFVRAIEEAPRYAEGRGVRLEVRAAADLDGVETLAAIKAAS